MNVQKVFKWLLLFGISLSILTLSVKAQEPSYDITHRDVLVELSAEGSANYTETITFNVDFINGIQHVIDYSGVDLVDYQVGVKDPQTQKITYFKESATHAPETFQTFLENQKMTFRVYYPSENEKVDFVFKYTLRGAVTNYADTAEFNGALVGNETDEAVDVTGEIRLPGRVEKKEDFRAWLFGDPQGTIALNANRDYSYVTINVPNNSANQFVEVQALFPTSLTPNNQKVDNRPRMQEVLTAADQRQQDELDRFQKSQLVQNSVVLVLTLLGPFITLGSLYYYFATKKRVNPKPVHVPEHLFELPEDLTPAIMAAAYLDRSVNTDDFSATIVDLARKGYIELIEESTHHRTSIFNRGDNKTVRVRRLKEIDQNDTLQKHEVYVYNYLFGHQEADEVVLSEIESHIHKSKSFAKQQSRLWTRFKDYAEAVGAKYYGKSYSLQMTTKTFAILSVIGAGVLPVITLLFVSDLTNKDYFISVALVSIANFLLALGFFFWVMKFPIYTAEEDIQRRKWRAFEKMLTDIGQFDMRQVAALPLWDEYLVYAISFGVADRVIDAMNHQYGMEEMESGLSMPRPFYSNPYLITRALQGSIHSSIAAAQPSTASNLGKYTGSNIGGFGGGASSGSSGGFGGGGGTSGF